MYSVLYRSTWVGQDDNTFYVKDFYPTLELAKDEIYKGFSRIGHGMIGHYDLEKTLDSGGRAIVFRIIFGKELIDKEYYAIPLYGKEDYSLIKDMHREFRRSKFVSINNEI